MTRLQIEILEVFMPLYYSRRLFLADAYAVDLNIEEDLTL
jgi:hypothetical protein